MENLSAAFGHTARVGNVCPASRLGRLALRLALPGVLVVLLSQTGHRAAVPPQAAAANPAVAGPYQPAALRAGLPTGAPAARPAVVPADTSAAGMAGVLADVRRRVLAIAPTPTTGHPQSSNPGQRLHASYGARHYQVAAQPDSLGHSAWRVRWTLASIGRAGQTALPATTTPDTVWAGPRLTYRQPAYDVVYDNTETGVRQSFVLHQRPAGATATPVRVQLAVTAPGLHWQADGAGAVTFRQGPHNVLRYADLHAWDATGHPLAAHLHATPDGALALEVADAGATYPLTIDPLASTTPATQLDGAVAGDWFGWSVAGAGDVDGDGYADVLVNAVFADPGGRNNAGSVYFYRGSATGLSTTAAIQLDGAAASDYFGYSVAGAGDINADGYADVLIGAYGGINGVGAAYVYLGSAAGLSATPATRLSGTAAVDNFGISVAGVGDVDADGYADIMVGAYRASPGGRNNAGSAYFYRGSAAGLITTVARQYDGTTAGDYFGFSVAGAGDVNSDGYADVVVGAYLTDPGGRANAGSAYLYLGSAAGLSAAAATQLTGTTTEERYGICVAGAGDVNGDGYADVLIGAYQADPGGRTDAGSAFLYRGSAAGLSTTATTRFDGAAAGDNFGITLSGAGDVDGDGYADVLVGAYFAGPSGRTDAGSAYLYRGSATGPNATATTQLDGVANGDSFGWGIAGVGDVNGDGYADIMTGAYTASTARNGRAGAAYCYQGSAAGLNTTATTQLDGATAGDNFGITLSGAGDVDGDGYADVLVGAYRASPGGRSGAGAAYLYRGSATGLNSTPATRLDGATAGDNFGYSVAGAGDVDGDGYADVLIGAYNADLAGRTDAGAAYLYRGSATGLSTTATTQLDGAAAGDNFGISVAGAGDVDGDGYADVLVGAYRASPGGRSGAGAAYLYRGSATGLNSTPATRLDGAAADDNFGISVAGAGDVDGDGYADVLVGAYNADPAGRTDAGAAYLYRGSAAGLNSTPATQLDGAAAGDSFGISVAGAGDVDGDGYADVLVGAYRASPSGRANAGAAYLYRGSAAGLNSTPTTRLDGAAAGDNFGYSVAGAGDVDGDGYADVLVGAYNADLAGRTNAGAAYLYRGSAAGLSTAATTRLDGATAGDYFGISVAGAGDVDGDGYADVLVGAYNADPAGRTNAGAAYLYRGNTGTARRGALRLYNTDLTTPLSASNKGASQFGLGLVARSPYGRGRVRLVWELARNGQPFSGAVLSTSTQATGRGPWTDLPAGTITELKRLVGKLGRATRVRARLEYASASLAAASTTAGTGGVGAQARYTPWVYASSQQLVANATAPLPVVLSSFTATPEAPATVRLAWATASEQNSRAFEVERSADGRTFAPIGTVAAAGSSSSPRAYALTDAKLPASAATLYYRLKQVDQDGTFGYSPVRTVSMTGAAAGLALYPNPAHSGTATLTGTAPGTAVTVTDALGRPVASATADAAGTAALALPAGLPTGVYLVRAGAQALRLTVE